MDKRESAPRLPTLLEVVEQRSKAPLDPIGLHVFLQESWNEDALEFWLDAYAHKRMCCAYAAGPSSGLSVPGLGDLCASALYIHLRYFADDSEHRLLFPDNVRDKIPSTFPIETDQPSVLELDVFSVAQKYVCILSSYIQLHVLTYRARVVPLLSTTARF